MEQKTEKILEVVIKDTRWLVIKENKYPANPYRMYEKWWDGGWHRKRVTEYADLKSVFRLLEFATTTVDGWLRFDDDGCLIVNRY